MQRTIGSIAFSMLPAERDRHFSPEQLRRIETMMPVRLTDFIDGKTRLPGVVALITGWNSPFIDDAALEGLPDLRAVFHAAGSVKPVLAPVVWGRGIRVTSAAAANAVPVAEFTVASIVFAGKRVTEIAAEYAATGTVNLGAPRLASIGNFDRTVGIVGASEIGRRVIKMLRDFDLEVLLYDPFVDSTDPILEHAYPTSLHELMTRSSIVSLHAPLLPPTREMISRTLLGLLPDGATIINTARAGLVDQTALVDELRAGRLAAVLDVTEPEPLPSDHPLRNLPNVFLTPHLAGSQGNELLRMGSSVVAEIEAFAAGRPPLHPVELATLARTA